VLPAHKLVVLTNGKCGGTSVKRWLFNFVEMSENPLHFVTLAQQTSFLFAWEFYCGNGRSYFAEMQKGTETGTRRLARLLKTRVGDPYLERSKRPEYTKLLIARDPVKRCISAYLNKFCGPNVEKQWAQEVIAANGTAGSLSFEQFVTYLETHDLKHVNGHWRQQTAMFPVFGDQKIYIARIEHIATDLALVPHDAVQANASKMTQSNPNRRLKDNEPPKVSWAGAASQVSNLELNKIAKENDGVLPPTDQFLDEDIVARIKSAYREDYDLLPYD